MRRTGLFLLLLALAMPFAAAELIDFSSYGAGDSIEGVQLGGYVTITSTNQDTIVVKPGDAGHLAYNANYNGGTNNLPNGCLPEDGGISDSSSTGFSDYTFTFTEPMSSFSVKMYDFGDWNYWNQRAHEVVLTAYAADDTVLDTSTLAFTSDTKTTGGTSPEHGYMGSAGDACQAAEGEPGLWTFTVAGDEIAYATLEFVSGTDPAMAFGLFSYEVACEPAPAETRTIGFWKHQFYAALPGGRGKGQVLGSELLQMLPITAIDGVEVNDFDMGAIIFRPGKKTMQERAVEQCFATQLNEAWGQLTACTEVDTDYDSVPDMAFGDAWDAALQHYADGEYEAAKDICDSINNMNE